MPTLPKLILGADERREWWAESSLALEHFADRIYEPDDLSLPVSEALILTLWLSLWAMK